VANTSSGVSAIAHCIAWRAGERILCMDGDFPANVTPWQRAADTFGLQVVLGPGRQWSSEPGLVLQWLEQQLRGGVRLVAVSAVQFQTGFRLPLRQLAELAHQFGAELFVDGIQAVGLVPQQVVDDGVDYFVSGGHKWLMGLEGLGFVYAAPAAAQALSPRLAGWLSHVDPARFLFEGEGLLRHDLPLKPGLGFLESGTQNAIGAAALEAALQLLEQLGVEAIFKHVDGYLSRLEAALVPLGFVSLRSAQVAERSGILCVSLPDEDLMLLQRGLVRRGIVCSLPDGMLRFAPHWPNGLAEIDLIVGAVEEVLREVRTAAG
jgi:cysteine desulfurase/selenocysteine lyase